MSDRRNAATYAALSGGRSAHSEPQGWLRGLNAVVARAGSVAGAARELDVPRRTLRRWLSGEGKPNEARRRQVQAKASQITRRGRLPLARENRLRKARQITIRAAYRYDVGDREITFHVGVGGSTGLDAAVCGDLVDAFLGGASGTDPGAGLFDVIAAAMRDDWYREHFQLGAGDSQGWDVEKVWIR